MTAVLVTGASTPIGEGLLRRLASDPRVDHVLGVWPREGASGPLLPRVSYVRADLTRERDLRNLLFGVVRELGTRTLIHAAHHRAARDRGRRVHALNVESTRTLLRLAERHPTLERFILRSFADVYQVRPSRATVLTEDHPLDMSPHAPQWVRDRVEAELVVGLRMGISKLGIAILRCAECLHPECGSQLFDYLSSNVCFTPLGFNPMLNLLSLEDIVDALSRAVFSDAQGVFNIPGHDTLPLSRAVRAAGRLPIPAPGPLLHPLYGLRALTRRTDFRYDQNTHRFHFGGILDGTRAREVLGYTPRCPVDWTRPSRMPAPAA
jgi:UDP-glucose 4-epimerase